MGILQDTLQGMINDSENQVENLEGQVDKVDEMISNLEDEAEAIEDGMLTPIADRLASYLNSTKVFEVEIAYGGSLAVVYGSNYNNLADLDNASITDWAMIDTTTLAIVYVYGGVGWDGDALITKWVGDWNWGLDYLIHPLTDFDGNYGIYPNITALSRGRSTLQGSRNKIALTEDKMGDYI